MTQYTNMVSVPATGTWTNLGAGPALAQLEGSATVQIIAADAQPSGSQGFALTSNGISPPQVAVLGATTIWGYVASTSAVAGSVVVQQQSGGNASFITLTAAQVVAAGAASAASAVTQATTTRIVLTPTVDCWVAIGATPTAAVATSGSFFLPAGVPSYPITVVGGTTKIAAIANVSASTGYVSVQEST